MACASSAVAWACGVPGERRAARASWTAAGIRGWAWGRRPGGAPAAAQPRRGTVSYAEQKCGTQRTLVGRSRCAQLSPVLPGGPRPTARWRCGRRAVQGIGSPRGWPSRTPGAIASLPCTKISVHMAGTAKTLISIISRRSGRKGLNDDSPGLSPSEADHNPAGPLDRPAGPARGRLLASNPQAAMAARPQSRDPWGRLYIGGKRHQGPWA